MMLTSQIPARCVCKAVHSWANTHTHSALSLLLILPLVWSYRTTDISIVSKTHSNLLTVHRFCLLVLYFLEKKESVLFNDTSRAHWFSYDRLLDVKHIYGIVTYFFRGNPLLPHRLLLIISSKGSFIYTYKICNTIFSLFHFKIEIDTLLLLPFWLFCILFQFTNSLPIAVIKVAIWLWNQVFYFLFQSEVAFSTFYMGLLFTHTVWHGWILYLDEYRLETLQ